MVNKLEKELQQFSLTHFSLSFVNKKSPHNDTLYNRIYKPITLKENMDFLLRINLIIVCEKKRVESNSFKFLNFCIYSKNSDNDTFQVNFLFSTPLKDLFRVEDYALSLQSEIFELNVNKYPFINYDGSAKDYAYDFDKNLLMIKIFFSIEEISTIQEASQYFHDLDTDIVNTKIPIIQECPA